MSIVRTLLGLRQARCSHTAVLPWRWGCHAHGRALLCRCQSCPCPSPVAWSQSPPCIAGILAVQLGSAFCTAPMCQRRCPCCHHALLHWVPIGAVWPQGMSLLLHCFEPAVLRVLQIPNKFGNECLLWESSLCSRVASSCHTAWQMCL